MCTKQRAGVNFRMIQTRNNRPLYLALVPPTGTTVGGAGSTHDHSSNAMIVLWSVLGGVGGTLVVLGVGLGVYRTRQRYSQAGQQLAVGAASEETLGMLDEKGGPTNASSDEVHGAQLHGLGSASFTGSGLIGAGTGGNTRASAGGALGGSNV